MNTEQFARDIYALYDECLEKQTPFHKKLDLFIVPDYLVQKVFESTGLDLTGHWVCIDNFGIKHALEQHGNPISEARRGQISIEKEDFVKFLDVFLEPDEIQLAGITRRTNLPLIQFVKIMEDKKFVIKEIRTIASTKKQKISRVVFHTMYKIKVSK
jgi:hypothetical protein